MFRTRTDNVIETDQRQFNVTFKTKNKYNPVTRTIRIEANNEANAEHLCYVEFGGFTKRDEVTGKTLPIAVPSKKKIEVLKVEEIVKTDK